MVGTKTGASSGTVNTNSSVLSMENELFCALAAAAAAAALCGESGTDVDGAPGLTRGETRGDGRGDGFGWLVADVWLLLPPLLLLPAVVLLLPPVAAAEWLDDDEVVDDDVAPAATAAFSSLDTILRLCCVGFVCVCV